MTRKPKQNQCSCLPHHNTLLLEHGLFGMFKDQRMNPVMPSCLLTERIIFSGATRSVHWSVLAVPDNANTTARRARSIGQSLSTLIDSKCRMPWASMQDKIPLGSCSHPSAICFVFEINPLNDYSSLSISLQRKTTEAVLPPILKSYKKVTTSRLRLSSIKNGSERVLKPSASRPISCKAFLNGVPSQQPHLLQKLNRCREHSAVYRFSMAVPYRCRVLCHFER